MENMFNQMADKEKNPQSQPSQPSATPQQPQQPTQAAPAPAPATAPTGDDLASQFGQMEQQEKQQNPPDATVTAANSKALADNSEAANELKRKQAVGQHSILARAWDWVNTPLLDNVLPEGIKTADIIKAAAFEKMYNEAYIPGVNDFTTKAATHFEPAEKMMAGVDPKEKDGYLKKKTKEALHQFLVDHAQSIDATANAVNTGVAGATRDTVDTAAGLTSPLSVGTLGLGKAGRVGKVLAPLVGTAFGLQGLGQAGEGAVNLARTTTWENLKNGYMDPDALQETLGGAGQAALAGTAAVHSAGDVVDFARDKSTPQIKTIGGQEVPVRAENATAQMVQKAVPDEVNQAAARQTGEAVKQGVGDVIKEATGSDADTNISHNDRLGIHAHADDLKTKATTAMDELNRLSDGMYNDARDMAEKSKGDQTTEGRDNVNTGKSLMRDIEEQYRTQMEAKGHDVDEMRTNYRKSIAMEKIAKKFEVATEASQGAPGEFDVNGKKLVKAIDDIRKVAGDENDPMHSKNWFHRAGIGEAHINALAELADTLREQQEKPKFGTLAKLGAKAIAVAAAGHGVGLGGVLEAITGESLAEHIGSKAMGKLFGDALTDVTTAKQLNAAIKGGPAAMSKWDKFKDVATRLWKDEHGQMEVPGTGNMGNVGDGTAAAPAKKPLTPINDQPRLDMNPERRENGDLVFNHPDGSSQMVLHPEPDPRAGHEGQTQLRQTGISAVSNPGAGQEMMDNAVARIKGNEKYSRVISDYPDRRSPDNEGHWNKLSRRGHPVQVEGSTDSFKQPWEDWVDPSAATDLNGGRSGNSYFIDNASRQEVAPQAATPSSGQAGYNPDSEIATREMTWKDKGETQREPNSREHVTGWDAIEAGEKAKPGYMRDLLDKILSYKDNGIKLTDEEIADPRKGLEAVINHLADNTTWLHDNMPPELRTIAKQWYDSAHVIAKDVAAKNGTTPEKTAAVIAALSPQNPWDMNVGQAERLVKMHQTMQDHPFTPAMDQQLSKEVATATEAENPEFAQELQSIRGKTLADLKGDSYKQALLMRVLDRAHGNAETPVYAPDGKIRSYQRFNWGLLTTMAKGIDIMEGDGSPQSIHEVIGDGHKIRNFYNNIISPNSPAGHATIDTHHVNADMLKPMSSKNDVEVKDNFGGSPKNGEVGLKGTYALHHEALKRAAAARGILPREMQSIVWEGIRTLMGESKKAAMRPLVDEIWRKYHADELTLNEARAKIVQAAGGFQDPIWAKERANAGLNSGSNEKSQGSPDKGKLPVLDVRGEASSNNRTRSRGNDSKAVPSAREGVAQDVFQAIRDLDKRIQRGIRK